MELPFKRIYLDSNVFISLFNKEIGFGLRGLFVEADSFFELVKKDGETIILSKWFFEEVEKSCLIAKSDILSFFTQKVIKFETVGYPLKDSWKEFAAMGIHSSDSLHVASAIEFKCDCIVTFNVKDFEKVIDIIPVIEPCAFS
jgi:predicted nucleic acid-binding protein